VLTNFMMLELLLTRQTAIDQQVVANVNGLSFLVLDELPSRLQTLTCQYSGLFSSFIYKIGR